MGTSISTKSMLSGSMAWNRCWDDEGSELFSSFWTAGKLMEMKNKFDSKAN